MFRYISIIIKISSKAKELLQIVWKARFTAFTVVTTLSSLAAAEALKEPERLSTHFSPFKPDLKELNPYEYLRLSTVRSPSEANYWFLAWGIQQPRDSLYSSYILNAVANNNTQIYFAGAPRANCSQYTISLPNIYCYASRHCLTEISFANTQATCLSFDSAENLNKLKQQEQLTQSLNGLKNQSALMTNNLNNILVEIKKYDQAISERNAKNCIKTLLRLLKSFKANLPQIAAKANYYSEQINAEIKALKKLAKTLGKETTLDDDIAAQLESPTALVQKFNKDYMSQRDLVDTHAKSLEATIKKNQLSGSHRSKTIADLILDNKKSNRTQRMVFIGENGFFFRSISPLIHHGDLHEPIKKALNNTKHHIIAFK